MALDPMVVGFGIAFVITFPAHNDQEDRPPHEKGGHDPVHDFQHVIHHQTVLGGRVRDTREFIEKAHKK